MSKPICEHGSQKRKCPHCENDELEKEIESLRAELAALKAQQREPVAYRSWSTELRGYEYYEFKTNYGQPLYTAPPNTEALKDALKVARDALENYRLHHGGYEMPSPASKAIAAIDAALKGE